LRTGKLAFNKIKGDTFDWKTPEEVFINIVVRHALLERVYEIILAFSHRNYEVCASFK